MKKYLIILAISLTTFATQARMSEDYSDAKALLSKYKALNIVCIVEGLAFGATYSETSHRILIGIDDVKAFGPDTQFVQNIPGGELSISVPSSLNQIPSSSIMGKDAEGNPLAKTIGLIETVNNDIACVYRANATLFEHFVSHNGSIQLE